MKRYELGIEILENDIVTARHTVYTHAENLDRAQRNIAWRTVVRDNPEAEYPGLAVRFEDGRVIDGSKKIKAIPLYIVLMHDLHKQEVYVDEECAKQLRKEYAVNKNNYAKKLVQIVDKFKAEETAKNESADAQKEEEVKMEKEIKTTAAEVINENAVPDMPEAVAAVEEEYPENIVTIDEQEKLFWKNNKALMKVILGKPFSEKYLYSKMFTILQYNHVDVVLIEGQENRFLHLNFNDSSIELPNKSAIDFGRAVWSEISEIGLDSSRVKNVRDQLTTLFTNNKGKQETTDVHKSETVENKTPQSAVKAVKKEENKLNKEEMALVEAGSNKNDRIVLDFYIQQKGKEVQTKRVITIKRSDPGKYLFGYVYGKGYVGCWQWILQKSYPEFGPAGKKNSAGKQVYLEYTPNSNIGRLLEAIRAALQKNGVSTTPVRTVVGTTHKKPSPVVVPKGGPSSEDLGFWSA